MIIEVGGVLKVAVEDDSDGKSKVQITMQYRLTVTRYIATITASETTSLINELGDTLIEQSKLVMRIILIEQS